MKSFIPWIGGKSLLAKKIVSMFPDDFDRYIEVFRGGGSVLFAKDKHAPLEVYAFTVKSFSVKFQVILMKEKFLKI